MLNCEYPDCPYGVDNIPEDDKRIPGICKKDNMSCWNSTCELNQWNKINDIIHKKESIN